MTAAMGLLLHLWLPVLTTLSMAYGLRQVFPGATLVPEGAFTLAIGVFAVYTADRLLEPGRLPARIQTILWAACGLAAVAMLYLAWRRPFRLLPIDGALGLASIAYGTLKRHPALKTALVASTWWIGCTLLPYDLLDARKGMVDPAALLHPAALGLALTVAAGALLCDFKDAERDAALGVRSLPVLFGERPTQWICAALAFTALVCTWQAGATALSACALLMLWLTPKLAWLRRPVAGPLLVDGALALPGVVLFVGY